MLVDAFDALRRSETSDIVFRGHNLIDTDSGWVEIPFETISAIGPMAIAMVVDDPDAIATRRAADADRKRPARDVVHLAAYRDRVTAIAREHAQRLGVPYAEVPSGTIADLEALVQRRRWSEE